MHTDPPHPTPPHPTPPHPTPPHPTPPAQPEGSFTPVPDAMPGPPRESASEGLLAEEAKEQAEKVAPAGRFGGYAVAAPA
eukprot:COSAG04_NODE_2486_length_4027_cov_4.967413_1_plen_79_part_10